MTIEEQLAGVLQNHMHTLPGFHYSEAQYGYGCAVAKVLDLPPGATGIIEGDTGIGKTLAYLLALMLWVRAGKNRQAVVSTFSRQLQMQLLDKKNINQLNKLLENAGQAPVNPVLRVGRGNYISPDRLAQKLGEEKLENVNASALPKDVKRLVELARTGGGCLLDYPGRLPEGYEDKDIGLKKADDDSSDYLQAKNEAEQSELVIVNHALLVHGLRMGAVVGEKNKDLALLLDEAEHFPEVAEETLSIGFSFNAFYSLIDYLRFDSLTEFWEERAQVFRNPDLADENLQLAKMNPATIQVISDLLNSVKRVRKGAQRVARDFGGEYYESLLAFCDSATHILKHLDQHNIIAGYSPVRGFLSIREPRIDAGRIILKNLGQRRTILTSATLSDLNHLHPNFTAIKRLTGIHSADVVGAYSPAVYGEMQFRIPAGEAPCLPIQKNTEGFSLTQEYASWVMADIASNPLRQGERRLLLCRSYKDVETLREAAQQAGLTDSIIPHREGTSMDAVIQELVSRPAGGTLITPAGWEGLSPPRMNKQPFWAEVGIVRLPFSPPDLLRQHALNSYLANRLNDNETRSIEQLSKGIAYTEDRNRMLHKLRQGIGRLIRHRNDRGTVVLYDPRFPRPGDGSRPMLIRAIPFRFRYNYQTAHATKSKNSSTDIVSML